MCAAAATLERSRLQPHVRLTKKMSKQGTSQHDLLCKETREASETKVYWHSNGSAHGF